MEDESGYARYSYNAMGNVSENCRTFALAAEDNAYTFIMNTEYDTWGRTLSITYPDKERVSYAYDFGGNLKSVSSAKNGNDKSLVDSIRYDKFGDRTAIYFGNGTTQHYSYNPTSRRLGNLQGRTAANALMQDITYDYDAVGNVTKTDNAAVAIGTLGGPYSCAYTYDHLNRLTATNCQQGNVGYTEQRTYLDDGRIATYDLNGTRRGYSYNTTQPHTLRNIHTLPNRASDVLFSFAWDAKGNMTAQNSQGGSQRNLVWDERNRMLGMVDNAASGNAAHYVYDAQGERTFKLTGYSNHTGADETSETYVTLDEPTLYASPYLTATATGYTKHYFAGTERLASAIGNGGLADVGQPIVDGDVLADKRMERDSLLRRVMEPYPLRINRNRLDTLYAMTRPDTTAELTYFFHPDHLGSASWITDLSGQPVQHLQYKPFGGDYIDQQAPNTDYSERFRFTGKERDAETGYDYFGARYYSSSLGIWLSVDPMSDKYPSLSPYVYCADNPMRLVDPSGEDISTHIDKDGNVIQSYNDGNLGIYMHSDAEINDYNVNGTRLENDFEKLVGFTLYEKSFERGGKIDLGSNQAEQWLKAFEGSFSRAWTNPLASLLIYATNAGNGDVFDPKSYFLNGSQISEGVYVSPRDLGNFAAGLFGRLSGLPKERTLASFGAFQLSGNNKKEFFNSYSKYYHQALGTMGNGLVPSQKTYGEEGISNYFQRLGYENIRTLEDFNRRYSDIWK